eukprot:gene9602-10589_t
MAEDVLGLIPVHVLMAILGRCAKQNPKAKKKHNKLKTKLSERLEADQLEAKIQATVDLVRKRLKLDETFIAAINMNIDYLISEKIPVEIISKIGEKSPKTLQLDLNIIKKRIRVLKINSLYEDSIKKCLQRNPSLLMSRLEDTLSQKVEAFRGLQLSLSVSEIAGVLERCPDIIEYLTLEKLVDKVEFLLKKLNFSNKQVRRMLIKHPAILTMGKDSLKEKTNFLFASFNANHDLISKYPRALQCPIKRLRERYLFLKQEELAGNEIKVRGWALKTLAVNSDAYFAGNIAKKPLKRFRDFQDQLSRE